MKRIALIALIFLFCLISMELAQAPSSTQSSSIKILPHFPPQLRFPTKPRLLDPSQRLQSTTTRRRLANKTPDVNWVTCPPEADLYGALCGTVNVPLDRRYPKQEKIAIYFELYRGAADPAESAILANFGGPGLTTTGTRGYVLWIFGQNLDKHDILLIDDRGRGLSGTINCPELQQGTAPWAEAEADCAAQLGDSASRYGTGEVAMDTEDVRSALGYDKVDYYGGSYGGADVSAYATRFGKHLRSIVLDAPFGTPGLDSFVFGQQRTHAESRMVRLDCQYSPTCSADHPNPVAELDVLIWRIRAHPVEGNAYDANGNVVHVRIDEEFLLNYLIDGPKGNFTNIGELLAAGTSLYKGDPQPLLRLGAECYFPIELGLAGDPTWFSVGDYVANSGADLPEAWNWSAPVPVREQQYAHAVSELPPFFFAPFSRAAVTGLVFSWLGAGGKYMLWWELPTPPSPIVPHHAVYPHVPTLVLNGDMDNRCPFELTTKVAALFPNSTFVPVAGAGHETVFYSQCARDLASQFIETLQVGDTSCLSTPETIFPAVGRFPLLARDARPAEVDQSGGNQIGLADRKIVTVAVAAATDALQRAIMGWGNGVGLRSGTFQFDFDPNNYVRTLTLDGCAFAQDVRVSGTVTYGADNSFNATLTVNGPGATSGQLNVEGGWMVPGPVGKLKVTGTLGGKQVAVLLPQA